MIAHVNIRGICSKIDELHHIISDNEIDIIGICESMLSDATSDDALLIDDYMFFRRDSLGNGGGICVFVRNNLCPELHNDLTHPDIEVIWLSVKPNKASKRIFICCLYRPPSANIYYFDCILDNFATAVDKPEECIILGDLNVDIGPKGHSNADTRIHNMCNLFGLAQLST